MTYSKPLSASVLAVAGLILAAAPASAGHHCVRAGGSATAVTSELAKAELDSVISDDAHAPEFQRKQERVWVQRARSLRRGVA